MNSRRDERHARRPGRPCCRAGSWRGRRRRTRPWRRACRPNGIELSGPVPASSEHQERARSPATPPASPAARAAGDHPCMPTHEHDQADASTGTQARRRRRSSITRGARRRRRRAPRKAMATPPIVGVGCAVPAIGPRRHHGADRRAPRGASAARAASDAASATKNAATERAREVGDRKPDVHQRAASSVGRASAVVQDEGRLSEDALAERVEAGRVARQQLLQAAPVSAGRSGSRPSAR